MLIKSTKNFQKPIIEFTSEITMDRKDRRQILYVLTHRRELSVEIESKIIMNR